MKSFAIGLLLSGVLGAPLPQQEPARAGAAPIQTVDEALARLPPIGREGTFDEAKSAWDFDPAVVWLKEHLASGGMLTDEQWRLALLRSKAIRVRERWPIELPFAISMEIPVWLSQVTEIRATPTRRDFAPARAGSLTWLWCGNASDANWRFGLYQELGKLELGPQTLSFDIVVERGQQEVPFHVPRRNAPLLLGPTAGVLWTGSIDFQVEGVPTIEEVLPGAHGEALDAAIQKALEPCIFRDTNLILRAERAGIPELASTAMSLELELFEGTTSRGVETMTVLERPGLFEQQAFWKLPDGLAAPALWSIHVRGRMQDALHAWNAERYWNGEIVIPLADVPRR